MEILPSYSYSEDVEYLLNIDRTTNKPIIRTINTISNPNTPIELVSDTKKPYGKTIWEDFIQYTILESNCGEGDEISHRFTPKTRTFVPIEDRAGLLDIRLKIIFAQSRSITWFPWTKRAYRHIYAYDMAGELVYITRKKLLDTFIDFCRYYKNVMPGNNEIHQIALILSYNIWQMDPETYKTNRDKDAPYATICDWKTNAIKPFVYLFPQEGSEHLVINDVSK